MTQASSAGLSKTADPFVMATGAERMQIGKKRLCKTKGIVLQPTVLSDYEF